MKAFVDEITGKIERLVSVDQVEFEPQREGTVFRDWPEGVDPVGMVWSFDSEEPVIDEAGSLAVARSDAMAKVKALREKHTDSGITIPGVGRVETDLKSRLNISGSVQLASIGGAQFSTIWRTEDNQYVTLDAAAMIGMGVQVAQHVAACQYRKNELDAAIEAAASLAELEATDLNAGWPGS
ncbi:DUF4376 domain-containing protein [Qipengyuania sp.]|uniref:DUF4376 domain-containing protein n=1 Tax=Qipengyuania sp. TaxID=2004515 RepID=UPI0035C8631D